jgi:AraC-like DNA-binding protein
MPRHFKVGRNQLCPCGSGNKFKSCCSGKVDWETIIQQGRDFRPYLTVRGRNLYFARLVSEALQLDTLAKPQSLKDYKAAFTTDAVRKIHEALVQVWPTDIDIVAALRRPASDVSGLYIGDYGPEYLKRAIVRHSIYANRIVLIDPFIYPPSVRDEYNPIVNPSQYRAQTLKNVNFWFALLPWIEAGIVELIRPPADFNHRLNWDLMTAQQKKFAESTELQKASEDSVKEFSSRHKKKLMYQQFLLGAPDSYLRDKFEELGLDAKGENVDDFLESIHREREQDPDFLEPMGPNNEAQLLTMTSGASYLSAAMTASITGSYLFTDIPVKWREIEMDRESHSAENKVWAPFAKALQNTPLRYLNNLRLEHALTLRQEGRLESLRGFLARVWKDAGTENQFDGAGALLLSEELAERIRDAEREWEKIDRDLLRIVGGEAVAGLLAAGPLIAGGHAYFLAAAAAVAGVGPLINSTLRRRSFADRFPAAFFMKIEESDT